MKNKIIYGNLVLLLFVLISFNGLAQTTPVKIRPVTTTANANQAYTLEQKRTMETEEKIKILQESLKAQANTIKTLQEMLNNALEDLNKVKQEQSALSTSYKLHYHSLTNFAVVGNRITNNAVVLGTEGGGNASDLLKKLRMTGPPVE
jgi:TRAP-type mannitol/chloroaromatic compound transport system substrate-binding protein